MSPAGEEKLGTVKISEEVIALCVMNATMKTNGVWGLSAGFGENLSKSILGKEPAYTGIRINQGDDGVAIDVYVIVKYGVKIPGVAWDIQENVKQEVEEILEMDVKAVNIHVQGVRFEEAPQETAE